ncbi:membrane protein [Jeongeupia sp. HS-3]|uniref:HPP family protein n=1 Tax=Jeongeupia sp. HS-3 TaxID=1009682 RepID=UPI0018A3594F|nr:HPP family protein [Jeongeupia sp. HS-3]BCL75866.1 membrane protein [Jeongeupia sp. HS-3]
MHPLLLWLRAFVPPPSTVSRKEQLLSVFGAGFGLLITEIISRNALGTLNLWFVAPMGASAVLLFAVPSSPLAQPWSILGGNLVSALIGVACSRWIGHSGLAAGLAGAIAIGAMIQLRCLHPPSGAVAATAVMGGAAVDRLGFAFAVSPVLVNSVLLVICALVFNNIIQRRYPHHSPARPNPHLTQDPLPTERTGIIRADLDAVIAERGEVVDISQDDLEEIVQAAVMRARQRHFGPLLCGEIMSRDVITVLPEATLADAWQRLIEHKLTTAPVADEEGRLVGILSMMDFFVDPLIPAHLRTPNADLQVSDLMIRDVRSTTPQTPIETLVTLSSDDGFHHLPVVANEKLVGIITQSDLLAAMYKHQLGD